MRTRQASLDGLRGVAALVVVVHHALLTFPSLASAYYSGGSLIAPGSIAWIATYTPLHLFWAGTEAVYLFFILSGVVLAIPVLQNKDFSWLAYYPRRIIRIYGPVLAAIAFGLVTLLLVPRFQSSSIGQWMNARPSSYTTTGLLQDATLIFGTSRTISPLWSLRWEIIFSLALPLFILFGVFWFKLWWAKLIISIGLIAAGAILGNEFMFYLPMFAIGVLLISRWEQLSLWGGLASRRPWVWPTVALVGVLLTCIRWELSALGVGAIIVHRLEWLSVVGVLLILLTGAFWAPVSRFLEKRPVQWLGAISFSIYLVHEPIVIATRFALMNLPPSVGFLVAILLSFVAAMLFTRFVERPFHLLASWSGRKVIARNQSR